jgi:aminodeoxyfutalosine synthase
MSSKTLNRVRSLIEREERITRNDCRELFQVRDLLALAKLARIPRERRFGRSAFHTAAHVVSYNGEQPESFISEAATSAPEGAVFVAIRCRLQSGETLARWQERLRGFSGGEIPATAYFSAKFIHDLATAENVPVGKVIGALHESGSIFITGEGAELFDEAFRSEHSRDVLTPHDWIAVHRAAHVLGLKTAAAMTYGTRDWDEQYAAHLDAIRSLQEETGGFVAFTPMALHNHDIESHLTAPTAAQTLRAVAVSRIFLDNIPHIAAIPSLVSTEVAVVALDHGADLVDVTVAVADVHSEDRHGDAAGTLKVLDATAASVPLPVTPGEIRSLLDEARWTAAAVNAVLEEVPVLSAA